jgi:hypothetical protein
LSIIIITYGCLRMRLQMEQKQRRMWSVWVVVVSMVSMVSMVGMVGGAQQRQSGSGLVGDEMRAAVEMRCRHDVTLSLAIGRVAPRGGDASWTSRVYNGQVPGPVLRVKAGSRCRVTLLNALPDHPDPDPDQCHAAHLLNNLHCPDHTNLHTHGLHVSPRGHADNINVSVAPQHSYLYEYPIPVQHMPGLLCSTHPPSQPLYHQSGSRTVHGV